MNPTHPAPTRKPHHDAEDVCRQLAELVVPGSLHEARRITRSRSTSSRVEARQLDACGGVLLTARGKTFELAVEALTATMVRMLNRAGRSDEASRILAGRRWRAVLRPGAVDRAARLRRLGIVPRTGARMRAARRAPRRSRRRSSRVSVTLRATDGPPAPPEGPRPCGSGDAATGGAS